jgi:ABC-type Mn2+/Zn2+ transport system ATPase subunit
MGEPIVQLSQVRLGYGPKVVLEEVNLTLEEGDFLGLVGPNGSGKTTLLRAILGQLRPQAGRVEYGPWTPGGEAVPPASGPLHPPCSTLRFPRTRFGYVPQHREADELFPLTALQVTLMGCYPQVGLFRWPGRAHREWALACLERVGAADLASQLFSDLSGGQKQRVLVARALATGAPTLLLDEPTNDMDLRSEYDLMQLFAQMHEVGKVTLVIVSHMLHLVLNYAARVAIIHGGRLRLFSTAELVGGSQLSEIYALPVRVVENQGHRMVIAGGDPAPGANHAS